jgi:lipid II:glycine glycyltransferase (peptidoglycan interpeptide bridge formation enzyme)
VNRYLAYIPEGPTLAWDDVDATNAALTSLARFLKARGVFQIKMGPHVWLNQWRAETIKSAIATGGQKRISQVKPDHTNQTGETLIANLRSLGWRQEASDADGFGDYQPRFVFQVDLTGQNAASIFENFNQLWRRNIRKAEKSGVTVRIATAAELPAFHECYVETATRDHFRPRPLEYFTHMYSEMKSEAPERIDLFIATHADHEGAIAATTLTQVGDHAWYSYGASTTAARDLRPSNAVQWAMLQTALERGAKTYDLRGITDTLDEADPMFGLINFKLGTGGQVIEYVGEWDLVLSPLWAKAFKIYMSRR